MGCSIITAAANPVLERSWGRLPGWLFPSKEPEKKRWHASARDGFYFSCVIFKETGRVSKGEDLPTEASVFLQ